MTLALRLDIFENPFQKLWLHPKTVIAGLSQPAAQCISGMDGDWSSLRHPGMIIHPPMLYLVLFLCNPICLAIAALITAERTTGGYVLLAAGH
jgi:cytochrome c-type biogenesis protein CcmF